MCRNKEIYKYSGRQLLQSIEHRARRLKGNSQSCKLRKGSMEGKIEWMVILHLSQ